MWTDVKMLIYKESMIYDEEKILPINFASRGSMWLKIVWRLWVILGETYLNLTVVVSLVNMLPQQLQLKKKGKFSYHFFIVFVTIISDLYNDDNQELNVAILEVSNTIVIATIGNVSSTNCL